MFEEFNDFHDINFLGTVMNSTVIYVLAFNSLIIISESKYFQKLIDTLFSFIYIQRT